MRRGAAVSLIGQTGHSDESPSPEEWASVVVRRMSPASLSIAVVWTAALMAAKRLAHDIEAARERRIAKGLILITWA
jgi:hypothetical protein